MKTRVAIVSLIGLALTGGVTAMLTMTPVTESRDQVTLSRPAREVAPPPPKAEIVLRSGNPLWGIPLRQFTASVARPLFAPTRRPPPPPVVAVSQAPPPPPKPEPDKPLLSLVGTVAVGASGGIGLFIDQNAKSVVRLKMGESHQGWILRNIQRRAVLLEKGREKVLLMLPETKMSFAAGGPAAPAVAVQTSPPPPPVSPAAAAPPPPPGAGAQAGPARADLPAVSASADGASPFAGMLQLLMNRQAR